MNIFCCKSESNYIRLHTALTSKALITIFVISLLPLLGYGATFTAVKSGNWNNAATWGGTSIPGAMDDVNNVQGKTISLTANASCNNLTLGSRGGEVIALGSNNIFINGNFAFGCTPGKFTTTGGYVVLNGTTQTITLCTGGGNSIPNLQLANSTNVSMGSQTSLTVTNFDCQTGSSTFTNNNLAGWQSGTFTVLGTCTAPNCTFIAGTNINGTSIDFSSSTSNPIQVGSVVNNQLSAIINFGSKNVNTTIPFSGTYTKNIIATGTVMTFCPYNSNTSVGITHTPIIEMPNNTQTVSSSFKSGQYFVMNVIKGLAYQIYTTSESNVPLKMTVYEEGNPSGSVLASSFSNTGNPGSTNANNVYLSFTSPLSGQIRVMISLQSNCSSQTSAALTIRTNVSEGNNAQDDKNAAGIDSWIGQVYDGISFNNYIGNYNVAGLNGKPDTFQESFGTGATWPNNNSDDTKGFNVNSDNEVRAQIKIITYSVNYRMNSTKRGFYTATVASDDGSKLSVDGKSVFDRWNPHSPAVDNNILFSLSGSSLLSLDYYEQNGQNIIGFYNFNLLFSNILNANQNQTVCKGTSGQEIRGDVFPSLPSGFINPGYQWYYSTAVAPTTRIPISEATSATYTPSSTSTPFNVSGTYYLYRVTSLTSTNYGVNSSTYTNESNVATIRVRSCPNYWIGTNGSSWQNATNWSDDIPADGDNIAFAATDNVGNNNKDAITDLVLDNYYTVGDLTNNSGKKLVIPTGTGLSVNGSINTNDVVGDKIYIKSKAEKMNGTLIFHNPDPSTVKATVEMYSKSSIVAGAANENDRYFWQYFGVPVTSVIAEPTLYGAYVRRAYEPGTDGDPYYWTELTNSNPLEAFIGHEICQTNPTVYTFKGTLVNTDFDSGKLPYTTGAKYPGQHLFANPYTAAIKVDKIEFGDDMDKTVFLYNTGSYGQWNTAGYQTSSGDNPGQYFSIPQNVAGSNGVSGEIPSMSSMLVKTGGDKTAGSYIKIKYSDVATKNTTMQRVKAVDAVSNTDLTSTMIDLIGQHYSDRMWIFTEATCTRSFDNGWDGRKILGSSLAPQIYAIEPDGDYQVNSVSDMHNTDLAFQAGDEVEYTLKFTHENIQQRYAGVYLVDLVENKTVDVTQSGSTYTFATAQADVPSKRFKVLTRSYEKGAPDKEAQVKIFAAPGRVFVHNQSNFNGECTLYDIAGRAIKKAPYAANAVTEVLSNLTPGAYVVNTITNGEVVSKRVIVQ